MTADYTLVEGQFGPRAHAYLASAVHAAGADLERIAEVIGERPDARAIDMGCGAGHAAYRVAPLVKEIVAYDVSPRMLAVVDAEARRRALTNLATLAGPAERVPLADASFDVAVTRYSVHHWQDARAGLAELRRLLKPGALAVISDVVSPGPPQLDTWLQAVEVLRDPSHVRDYTLAEWLAMLAAARLLPVDFVSLRLRLEFATWIERMRTPPVRAAAIRSLQEDASSLVAKHFSLEPDGSFSVDAAVIVARASA